MVTTEMSEVREERETMQGTVSDVARRLSALPVPPFISQIATTSRRM